jgi:DNA-binding MarR family transcriptional regulator
MASRGHSRTPTSRDIINTLGDFLPLFNDKLASIFPAVGRKARPLTKSQVGVLVLLRRVAGRTATDLGAALIVTKAGLTSILDVMESQGLLARAEDAGDRRKIRLELTEAGRNAADAVMSETERLVAERIRSLSAGDREKLVRHLAVLTKILNRI